MDGAMTRGELPQYYEECEWRTLAGDSNIWISNSGIVVSYKRGFCYELTQTLTSNGYLQCNIGRGRDTLVHRIVARTWKSNPNPSVLVEVNHRDGDKINNWDWNLEWVTHLTNIRHSIQIGLKGPSPQSIPIRIIDTNEIYPSIVNCARAINGNDRDIWMCLTGRRNTHKGYRFEYLER